MPAAFRTDVRDRLPLPLARLYRRTHNAKSWVERHANALYLLEASVKLAASAQISIYLSSGAHIESVDRRLQGLALPSLGRWVEFLREVSKATAGIDPHPFPAMAGVHALLGEKREDLPRLKFAVEAMASKVHGVPAFSGTKVRAFDLVDRLPSYRNQIQGHGGMRSDAFYREMADILLDATVEWLEHTSPFGGSVLVYIDGIHVDAGGGHRAEVWDLTGPDALRASSPDGDPLPPGAELHPDRLYLRRQDAYLDLHPLVVSEPSPPEPAVLFLNRSQVDRRVEYLDYVSGETSAAPHLLADHRAVLGRVLGAQVSPEKLEALQEANRDTGEGRAEEEAPTTARRFGDFDLLAQIGAGGMGTVHLARQRSLGRLVALKLLPPSLAADEVAEARFRREVHAMSRADHPNVVRVLQSGRTEGTPWFAMELVEGGDLREVAATLNPDRSRGDLSGDDLARAVVTVSDHRREEIGAAAAEDGGATARAEGPAARTRPTPDLGRGRSYYRRLSEVFRDAARGLQHLHDRGVLHRDVKPGNVMLTRDEGRAVVMDLGLARVAEDSALTRPQALLGTIQYAAPEQLQQGLLTVDTRADVYGLGATLYELTAGRPPYQAESTEALVAQVLRNEPTPPRRVDGAVPADLDAVIRKAMDRDVDRRYRSMNDFADDLDRFALGEPVQARPPGLGTLFRLWVRRHAALAALSAASLLVIVIGTVLFLRSLQEQRDVAEHERGRAEVLRVEAERERDRAVSAEERAQTQLAHNYLMRAAEADTGAAALMLAARAVDVADLPETRGSLIRALPRVRGPLWTSASGVAGLVQLTWTPDGKSVATGGDYARLWDIDTGLQRDAYVYPDAPEAYVVTIAFDPGGKRMVTGCIDGRVLLWDVATPTGYPGVMTGHEEAVMHARFLSDGRRVATASRDGTVRLWDTANFEALAVWRGHDGPVQVLAASPDEKLVASGGRDGTIRLWEVATGKEAGRLASGQDGGITHVSFLPEGRLVASHAKGAIVVWDLATARPVRTVPSEGVGNQGAALTRDRTGLLSVHVDGTIRLTNLTTGQVTLRIAGHAGIATGVGISPDGRLAATGGLADQSLRLWDLETGRRVAWLEGHGDQVFGLVCVGERRLGSASGDGTVRLWDSETGREVAVSEKAGSGVLTLAVHPDASLIAAGYEDNTLKLLDARTLERRRIVGRHEAPVSGVIFSKDGQRLAAVDRSGYLSIWDLEGKGHDARVRVSEEGLHAVALSPNGEHLAVCGVDTLVRILDANTGEEVHRLAGHTREVVGIAYAPDGTRLYSVSMDRSLRVWDTTSGELLHQIAGHDAALVAVAVRGDGARIAVGSWNGRIQIYETGAYQPVERLEGHPSVVWALAFAREGRRLYSAGQDRHLRAFSFDPPSPPPQLFGTPKAIREAVTHPAKRRLATGGEDPLIRIWDPDKGVVIQHLIGHQVGISGLVWKDGGDRLVSVGADETIRIWNPETGELETTMRWKGLDYPWDAALAPAQDVVAVACDSGVRIWDLETETEVHHLATPPVVDEAGIETARSDTVAVDYSLDGRHLIAGTWDGWVLVWDPAVGRVVRSWRADEDALFDVAPSPDGATLATAGRDPAIGLWSADDGTELARLDGHARPVVTLAWSGDGRRLFSASSDHTVRVWDVETRSEIARLDLGPDQPVKVSVDASGLGLAVTTDTGTIHQWTLEALAWPAGACVERARARTGFSLELPFAVKLPNADHLIRIR